MEEEPTQPFLVLGDILQDFGYIEDRAYFRVVECGKTEAYGCGPNGDAIVRGLALFVRLGGDDQDPDSNPKLCIGATDEVFVRVGSEIDDRRAKVHGRELRLSGRICTMDGDVMVVRVSFVASFSMSPFRTYYLVYDSAAASLSLLPGLPPCCRSVCTDFPLNVKVGEEHKRYSLVLMADRSVSPTVKYTDPVLCLWSPPSSPDENRPDYSKRAWDLKARVRVNAAIADTFEAETFEADVAFSFKGHAVWGDLAQGILYCDSSDLVDDTAEPVDFKHVMLPDECRFTDDGSSDIDRYRYPTYRTIAGVGDSVWLIVIEPSFTCPGDTTVKVWTLDLLSADEEKKWNLHREFKMQSVWELEAFRAQGLPETVPKNPMLLPQQDDCALCMFLREPYTGGGTQYAHLVCIDLSSSSRSCEVLCLLSNRRLAMPLMDHPVVLDPDFFDHSSLGQFIVLSS